MRRVAGKDAIFLYSDSPTTPMHMAFAGIFDPSTIPGGISDPSEIYARIYDHLQERIHLFPPFRQRLLKVPFGLNHPVFIEDPDFDIEFHLRRTALPSPGGRKELEAFIGRLMSRPMDMNRPLWEAWIVENVEEGRWAFVAKAHHVIVDGVGGNEILINLLDLTPEPRDVEPPDRAWEPEHPPGELRLLADAVVDTVKKPTQLAGTIKRTGGVVKDLVSWGIKSGEADKIKVVGPRTFLNGAVGPHRQIGLGKVSLEDVKDAKNAAGCKVNDVVLAMVGRALHRFLENHDQVLDRSLVAAVPISIRPEGNQDVGNQVSGMTVPFHDDVEDPVEQLALISEATRPAKEQLGAVAATVLTDWSEYAPPAVAAQAFRFYSRMRLAERHPPIANVTLSNVPGPPFPIYMAGSKMDSMYPIGPVIPNQALNITVVSYLDEMCIGIIADRDRVPDVEELVADMDKALHEIMEAVGA